VPIYDFKCQDCGQRFEALVRGASKVACPGCKSERLEQLISAFAMSSDSTRKGNIAKQHKHNEKARRDAKHAQREAMEHHDHHH
jgi:putative FmdB family regulatory protein